MAEQFVQKPGQENLMPEDPEILLFPQPGQFIVQGKKTETFVESAGILTTEYFSILEALAYAFDQSRIQLVATDLRLARSTVSGGLIYKSVALPETPGFKSIKLGGQESRVRIEDQQMSERVFLRDLFTSINGEIFFIDPISAPDVQGSENVIVSPLGEGGKVLSAGKSVILTEGLWRDPKAKKDIDLLRKKGYRIAFLPEVDPHSQPESKRSFVKDHIDGHVALILGKDGKPYILHARSYNAGKKLANASEILGAKLIQVDDRNLPPLAFNVVQLPDGKIVMTGGADMLKTVLERIVGTENVIPTEVPISEIPHLSGGSIRCMVNIAPESIVNKFNPTPSNGPILAS